jgi:tyrosyl-tRNA synthetase
MFGKIMSVSDDLMWRYFELLSFRPITEIKAFKEEIEQGANPRDIKFKLAEEIITRFHDAKAAEAAQADFINRFSKNAIPDDMPEVEIKVEAEGLPLANVIKEAGLVSSTSDAHRMVKQGAVKIDGERVEDSKQKLKAGFSAVMQVGKRKFARISLIS